MLIHYSKSDSILQLSKEVVNGGDVMQDNNLNNPNEQESIIDVPYTPEPEQSTHEEETMHTNENQGPRPNKDIPLPPYIEPNGTYYHETIKDQKRGRQAGKKQGPGGFGKFVAGLVIVSMVGGISLGAGYAFTAPLANKLYEDKYGISNQEGVKEVTPYAQSAGYVAPLSSNNSIADIAENVGPSVVSIKNNKLVTTWAGEFNQEGLGSGVIFKVDDQKVYIISNAHVVEGATTLTVTFLGNSKVPANIIGYDTVTDIAVVAVDKADIPAEVLPQIKPAVLGDNDKLRVGDLAVAIGTPIDEAYENTVTVGVVSALDREINLTDQKLNLIQTDAAINPGNSGGALVGPTGEVVGINTIKLVDSEIEGMGFAIPINDVKPIVEELMVSGSIARPVLGIVGENLTEELGNYWDIPVGIMVVQVQPGTSADVAGIKQGDVILEFDGTRISTMEELKGLLLEKKVGDQVKVKVVRGSQKMTVDVKLQGKTQPVVQ